MGRKKEINKFVVKGKITEMILENINREEMARTIIDTKDLQKVINEGKWSLVSSKTKGNYAGRYIEVEGKKTMVHLNRFLYLKEVLELQKKHNKRYTVDHINGYTLDNRRRNLRIASSTENNRNKHKDYIAGVYKIRENKYQAYIGSYKKLINLGTYATKEEAENKRLRAEAIFFKKFSPNLDKIKKLGLDKTNKDYKTIYLNDRSYKKLELYLKENTKCFNHRRDSNGEWVCDMTFVEKDGLYYSYHPDDGVVLLGLDILIKSVKEI